MLHDIVYSIVSNDKNDIILDKSNHILLSSQLSKMNKLGAFILFTSQGVPLIHQGQEWGHSQIIQKTDVMDLDVYKMDSNPYNKDNETNWVNWNELKQNEDLVSFYKKLITIRKAQNLLNTSLSLKKGSGMDRFSKTTFFNIFSK